MFSTKPLIAPAIAGLLAFAPGSLVGQTDEESGLRSKIQKLEQAQQPGESFAARDDAVGQERGEEALQEYLAAKLVLDNYSKIRLAELAAERAQFDPVKQLAEQIAEDHRQLNTALQQVVPISDLFKIGPSEVVPQPNSLQTDQQGQRTGEQAPSGRSREGQQNQQAPGEAAPLLQAGLAQRLLRIDQQAAANHLQMSNQMLQEYDGQDFDMAFLSHQAVTHTRMLADLQAMQGIGAQDYQKVLQRAMETTQEHLRRAKQLAMKFEKDRPRTAENANSGSGQRSGNRER